MASGVVHFWIMFALTFSLFAGGVLVDVDHLKTHSIKQLWDGFRGKSYVHSERDDSHHFFHKPTFYRAVFLATGIFVMFSIGLLIHLRLDKII